MNPLICTALGIAVMRGVLNFISRGSRVDVTVEWMEEDAIEEDEDEEKEGICACGYSGFCACAGKMEVEDETGVGKYGMLKYEEEGIDPAIEEDGKDKEGDEEEMEEEEPDEGERVCGYVSSAGYATEKDWVECA